MSAETFCDIVDSLRGWHTSMGALQSAAAAGSSCAQGNGITEEELQAGTDWHSNRSSVSSLCFHLKSYITPSPGPFARSSQRWQGTQRALANKES